MEKIAKIEVSEVEPMTWLLVRQTDHFIHTVYEKQIKI